MTEHDAAADETWSDVRERVRELIRAEIAASRPTEDARRALELIVESSLRYGERDGHLALTAIHADGQAADDAPPEAVIRALLGDLRQKHPGMFAPEVEPSAEADSQTPGEPKPEPQRDWLSLGSDNLPAAAEMSPPGSFGDGLRVFRSNLMRNWSPRLVQTWRGGVALLEPKLRIVRDKAPHVLGRFRQAARGGVDAIRARSRGRTRPLAIGAAALAGLVAVGLFAASRNDSIDPADAAQPDRTGSVVTERPGPLSGVPEVIDTATLSLQGRVIHLFGVEWAPGAGKPDDLAGYLAGRSVTCTPVESTDSYRCEVGGQDLSKVILFNGGGRATAQATPELKAAADKARQDRLGVWSK